MEVDVLIVGAGPAGTTTARYCAGDGTDVLVIDRRREVGYPVQCGEMLPDTKEMYSIFPRGEALEELFTVDSSLVSRTCDEIHLVSPGGKIYRCDFRSRVLERRLFDKHLATLAVEAGARLETGVSFLSLRDGVAQTTLGPVRAKVVVGADGPNSRVAREGGLERPARRFPAITCQVKGEFGDSVQMVFGDVAPGGYAWVIPKHQGANVGLGFSDRLRGLRPSVALRTYLDSIGCEAEHETLGFVPMSGPSRSTVRGRVMLVGDSAGHTMASNGGGIPTAMIAGRIAGRAIRNFLREGGSLSEYDVRWRRVMEDPLKRSFRTKQLAGIFFPSDALLGLSMAALGRRGLDRAIRCKRLFL